MIQGVGVVLIEEGKVGSKVAGVLANEIAMGQADA